MPPVPWPIWKSICRGWKTASTLPLQGGVRSICRTSSPGSPPVRRPAAEPADATPSAARSGVDAAIHRDLRAGDVAGARPGEEHHRIGDLLSSEEHTSELQSLMRISY